MSEPCALGCGNPVNPHDAGTWKQVVGFVGGPRKDSMRLRQDTGKFAHNTCVAKLGEGQAIEQGTLWEQDAEYPKLFERPVGEQDLPEELRK